MSCVHVCVWVCDCLDIWICACRIKLLITLILIWWSRISHLYPELPICLFSVFQLILLSLSLTCRIRSCHPSSICKGAEYANSSLNTSEAGAQPSELPPHLPSYSMPLWYPVFWSPGTCLELFHFSSSGNNCLLMCFMLLRVGETQSASFTQQSNVFLNSSCRNC